MTGLWAGNIFGLLRVCVSVLSVSCALQLCVALVETECLFAADAEDSYSKREVSRLDYIYKRKFGVCDTESRLIEKLTS